MPNRKAELLAAVCASLEEQLERIERASRDNAAAVNDAENKAEGEYDTRGLEASYLAGGQAQVAVEIMGALAGIRSLASDRWAEGAPIAVGAWVRLGLGGRTADYLLAHAGGGLEVSLDGVVLTVITPASPLGRLLLGKRTGDVVEFPKGPAARRWSVLEVL
jgi:transcription elongation GreA/GreB family factor